jgi:hypothetical protein
MAKQGQTTDQGLEGLTVEVRDAAKGSPVAFPQSALHKKPAKLSPEGLFVIDPRHVSPQSQPHASPPASRRLLGRSCFENRP